MYSLLDLNRASRQLARSRVIFFRTRGTIGAGFGLGGLVSFLLFGGFLARAPVLLTAGFLTGIVGYVPPATLEVKTVQRHQFFQSSIAVWTVAQRRIRELLQGFADLTAFVTLVLVDGHAYSPPIT